MDYAKESLRLHGEWKGKIEVISRVPVSTKDELSLAYTPGVAQPCLEIQKDIDKSYDLTRRSNLCAVITDGSAVLGLGDIGLYRQIENMMNHLYKEMKLKYEWRFVMFGGFSTDQKLLEDAQKGMERGILSDTYIYLALKGRTLQADIAMSRAVYESGVLDMRIPLVTSYSAKQDTSNLPPRAGGRPQKKIEDMQNGDVADGQEEDLDQMGDSDE